MATPCASAEETFTPPLIPAGGTYNGFLIVGSGRGLAPYTIYYTTDGSNPTTSSTRESIGSWGAFRIDHSLKVKAVAQNILTSEFGPVISEKYKVTAFPSPRFSRESAKGDTLVTITNVPDDQPGYYSWAAYYTVDGSDPRDPNSTRTLYTGGIAVSSATAIKAAFEKTCYEPRWGYVFGTGWGPVKTLKIK